MDFDPRDFDSRDDERQANTSSGEGRGGSSDRDRDDDWSQPDTIDCIHNRARLYHVHSKALYHVIGGAGSRYRRPVSPRLAIERLMLLDAVLTTPDLEWFTTAAEKAAYLARLTAADGARTEQTTSSEPAAAPPAALPGTFPIGMEPDGRTVLLYLATEAWADGFRTFLRGHAALLRFAPTWMLRIAFPRPLHVVYDAYQLVIHEELESPLHPATIGELKWYFEHRRKADLDEPIHPLTQGFLNAGTKAYVTPKFDAMYRAPATIEKATPYRAFVASYWGSLGLWRRHAQREGLRLRLTDRHARGPLNHRFQKNWVLPLLVGPKRRPSEGDGVVASEREARGRECTVNIGNRAPHET
jgi:hypothetical protein